MDRRYVGIDLHRRRSVVYAMDAVGDKLFCERISNDGLRLLEVVSAAGEGAEVVIEATYGWYWAVDLLRDAGFNVHLAHPSAGQERRARRTRPRGSAAVGSLGGGVDRATGGAPRA
jgi:transposase